MGQPFQTRRGAVAGGLEYAAADAAVKVHVRVEERTETVDEDHRTERAAALRPGLRSRRQHSTTRRKNLLGMCVLPSQFWNAGTVQSLRIMGYGACAILGITSDSGPQ